MPAYTLKPLVSLFSVFVYKENYLLRQKIGVVFGVAAIVFLNL